MIDDLLKEFIGENFYVYIDAVIVFGSEIGNRHCNLEEVFSRLLNSNLKVKVEKTQFLSSDVPIIGYILSGNGIRA